MSNLKTTLGEIYDHNPYDLEPGVWNGFYKLTKALKTDDRNTVVSLRQILEICGVDDAFWALQLISEECYLELSYCCNQKRHEVENHADYNGIPCDSRSLKNRIENRFMLDWISK